MLHTLTVPGSDQQLVFLHGLFGQGKNFLTIAKAVTDLTTCHLVDLPNHGRSPWTDRIDYPAMAEAVAETITRLDRPVALVGHSMGGKVAMRVALDHPELVERLMVVDIAPRAGLGTNFAPFFEGMLGLDLEHLTSRREADELLTPHIPDPVVRGFLMQNLRHEHGGWHWQMNLRLLADSMPAISGWPDASPLHWDGPVLWVAGERSPYVTEDDSPTMRTLFPRVRKVVTKNSGHWVHSEQPAAFTSILRAFLYSEASRNSC